MNPYAAEYLHRDRMNRLERNANQTRHLREALANKPGFLQAVSNAIGKARGRIEVDNGLGLRPFRPAH